MSRTGSVGAHLARITELIGETADVVGLREAFSALSHLDRAAPILADHFLVGLIHTNAHGRLLRVDDQALRLLGTTTLVDRESLADLFPGAVREAVDALVAGVVCDGVRRHLELAGDLSVTAYRSSAAGSRDAVILLESRAVQGPAREKPEPERRELERHRHALAERDLRLEKMDALERLAGTVAHDLNNVLAAIANFAALSQLSDVAEVRENAQSVLAACLRGKQLTGDLLRFPAAEPDRLPAALQPVLAEALEVNRARLPPPVERATRALGADTPVTIELPVPTNEDTPPGLIPDGGSASRPTPG